MTKKEYKKKLELLDWNKISIEKYDAILPYLTDIENNSEKLFSILLDMPFEKILELDYKHFYMFINKLFLLRDFQTTIPKKKYVINGTTYNCDIRYNLNGVNMRVDQYVSFLNNVQNTENFKYENILSILLIPEGATFNDGTYSVDDLAQTIYKHFSIADANSITFFLSKALRGQSSLFSVIKQVIMSQIKRKFATTRIWIYCLRWWK